VVVRGETAKGARGGLAVSPLNRVLFTHKNSLSRFYRH
jgi:hypothetical protein